MTFIFTLKGLPGESDMVIPAFCNGPDHAKARARDLLARHPGRHIVEVAHRGKPIFRLGTPPALEL
ncbi:hypothetical protein ACO2Q3_20485 [Caulobacter sp. KR2-114]|uniref:hypothetical protein n=1 Tax=Caulobacter sp. KR2-114 TaxID=3400912 RepID=UPI003C05102B